MVTHTLNLCSAFNPSKLYTHTVNTHLEQWAAIYTAAPEEQLRVRCLAQGHLVVVLRMERALVIHSPTDNPCRTRDSNSQPLDYESDPLTIRPRLPGVGSVRFGPKDGISKICNICSISLLCSRLHLFDQKYKKTKQTVIL